MPSITANGIIIQNCAILEAARLALVGVTDNRLGLAGRIGDRLPLLAGWKAGPAAPSQLAGFQMLDAQSAGVISVTARVKPA